MAPPSLASTSRQVSGSMDGRVGERAAPANVPHPKAVLEKPEQSAAGGGVVQNEGAEEPEQRAATLRADGLGSRGRQATAAVRRALSEGAQSAEQATKRRTMGLDALTIEVPNTENLTHPLVLAVQQAHGRRSDGYPVSGTDTVLQSCCEQRGNARLCALEFLPSRGEGTGW